MCKITVYFHASRLVVTAEKCCGRSVSSGEELFRVGTADDKSFLKTAWRRTFRRRLKSWYAGGARDLPWRRTRDPYRIWVSEIMLQQTQVQTVIPYFERFCAKFPTLIDLAQASEEQVLQLWEGLGYYRRGRQLHAAAKQLVAEKNGAIPKSRQELEQLPGVGRYTAAAILSLAFDIPEPILEANTIRLFARLSAMRSEASSSQSQKWLWSFSESILPRKEVGEFNQALMELGSVVCTPKSPNCAACPVADLCLARQRNLESKIPVTRPRVALEKIREAAIVICRKQRFLLRQCGPNERWSGLWDFPRMRLEDKQESAVADQIVDGVRNLTGYTVCPGSRIKTLKHGVTRYQITLDCYEAIITSSRRKTDNQTPHRWVRAGEFSGVPLSATGRKIAQHLVAHPTLET